MFSMYYMHQYYVRKYSCTHVKELNQYSTCTSTCFQTDRCALTHTHTKSHHICAYKNSRCGRRSRISCSCGRGSLCVSIRDGGRQSVLWGASERTNTATRKRKGKWTSNERRGQFMPLMLLLFGQEWELRVKESENRVVK